MNVIFYSTHCPKCKVLKMKLDQMQIPYTEIDDVAEMQALNIKAAPALKVDDKILDFNAALKWISAARRS